MARDADPDDIVALLDDLRTTLDDLERTLERDRRRQPRSRSRRPAPPGGRDILRFTEEYTIPTVIAVLETTIQSLELLRGLLRLVDPEPGSRDHGRLDAVDGRVVAGTERAVEELRRVLTGTEPPSDPVAREVFEEARTLSAELESALAESREGTEPRASRDRGVVIPVDGDETDADDTNDEGSENDQDESSVDVDVDAELESIREEVNAEGGESDAENGDGPDDATQPREDAGDDER